MSIPTEPRHPGERIKTDVFPANMTVTKAAELLDVGRPRALEPTQR